MEGRKQHVMEDNDSYCNAADTSWTRAPACLGGGQAAILNTGERQPRCNGGGRPGALTHAVVHVSCRFVCVNARGNKETDTWSRQQGALETDTWSRQQRALETDTWNRQQRALETDTWSRQHTLVGLI